MVSITIRGLAGLYRRIVYMGLNHCRVSHRGASRGPARSSGGPIHDGHLAICPLFCGRSYVLRGGRRVDTRFTDVATLGLMVGFVIMMILDVALG